MNPLKNTKKRHFEAENKPSDFSNPSGSTFKPLTVNKLAVSTDKKLTKSIRGLNNTYIGETMRLNYKKAKIYDGGGDLKKQWFVYYSFKNPVTGKFERYKVFREINQETTKAERYKLANAYKDGINKALEEGSNPFEQKDEYEDQAQNIITCIDKFLDYIASSNKRYNTKRKYKYELNIFKDWINSTGLSTLKIGEIKKQNVFEFIAYLKSTRKIGSGKTVNHYLNDIRAFFNHYIDNYDEYLERNPASKITRDLVEEKGNIAFNEDEFNAIKAYCLQNDPYLWLVCQVIYYTGLRNEAELPYLRCGDFDIKNKLFFVESWVAKSKTRQPVPIYPDFEDLLLTLNLDQYPADWFLFGRGDKPGPIRVGVDNHARRFRPVKKYLGMGNDRGLYCLKGTRACHLFDDGASVRDIQLLFRHADPLITMKYLKSLGRVERGRTYDKGRRI